VYGARPLKRFLSAKVETLVAKFIIAEDPAPDTLLTVDLVEGALAIR
jgi:ATP-dependent Clp protease ATP-binding subunit ClpB